MAWQYFNPEFEYEQMLDNAVSSWAGHRFFAFDIISNFKPKTVVELGTWHGTSFFSFCQGAKNNSPETKLYAIDSWQGDPHTGEYGEEIFAGFQKIINTYYRNVRHEILKLPFDQALSSFADNSIDLLHIDGYHTYGAAKHDFENWLSKVTDNGIIIFHDIEIDVKDFGVYKLWEELKEKFVTMEFHHSYGLGILFKNPKLGNELKTLQPEWQRHYSYLHENFNQTKIISLSDVLQQANNESAKQKQIIEHGEQKITQAEQIIEHNKQTIEQHKWVIEQDKRIIDQDKQIINNLINLEKRHDQEYSELKKNTAEKESLIESQREQIKHDQKTIEDLTEQKKQSKQECLDKDSAINEQQLQLEELRQKNTSFERESIENNTLIESQKTELAAIHDSIIWKAQQYWDHLLDLVFGKDTNLRHGYNKTIKKINTLLSIFFDRAKKALFVIRRYPAQISKNPSLFSSFCKTFIQHGPYKAWQDAYDLLQLQKTRGPIQQSPQNTKPEIAPISHEISTQESTLGKTEQIKKEMEANPLLEGKVKANEIVVIIHLYYPDMWEEICKYLDNLPYDFYLMVSLTKGASNQNTIKKIRTYKPKTKIKIFDNKGMDILPFLKCLKEIPIETKYILKLHTKKSLHMNNGKEWFNDMMEHVLPSKQDVDLILYNLEFTDIGMIGGSRIFDRNTFYDQNIEKIESYLKLNQPDFNWISGTIFWTRLDILKPLINDDFIKYVEENQPDDYLRDNTIIHGLERVFGLLVYNSDKIISAKPIPPKKILFISHQESLTGAPKIIKLLIDAAIQSGEFRCYIFSKIAHDDKWDYPQIIRLDNLPGIDDQSKMEYLDKIIEPDIIFANSAETMYLARHFNGKKMIFIHEFRSLNPYRDNLKILKTFDKVLIGNQGTHELLKSHGVKSEIHEYYLDVKLPNINYPGIKGDFIVGMGYVIIQAQRLLQTVQVFWVIIIIGILGIITDKIFKISRCFFFPWYDKKNYAKI